MTAALGVNDDEIGVVIKRALDTPYVGGVTIQPVFGSGRSAGHRPDATGSPTPACSPGSRSRPPAQVTWRDLTALPCSHPHCCSVGYLLRDDSGTWQSLTALIGHDRLKQWLDLEPDLLANRIADDAIPAALRAVVKGSLLDLLSRAVVACRTRRWRRSGATSARTATSASAPWPRWRRRALPGQRKRLRRDAGRAGAARHRQAVHGHEHDDRGAAHPVLRARRHRQRRRPAATSARRSARCRPGRRCARSRISTAAGLPLLHVTRMSDPRQVSAAPRRLPRRAEPPFDPLRLCVFATVALLGWLLGPGRAARLRRCWRSSATRGPGAPGCCARSASWATPGCVLVYLGAPGGSPAALGI